MGMSSSIVGLRSKNEEWKKKRAAVKALVDADEPVPAALLKFFGDLDPEEILEEDTAGLEVEIPSKEGSRDETEWIEILVKDIPAGVERIRFSNSW